VPGLETSNLGTGPERENSMRLDLNQLALLGILAATIHWIVARSKIAEPFWSLRWWKGESLVRNRAAGLLACAACSGFWIGLGLGLLGVRPMEASVWFAVPAAGLMGAGVTPVVEAVLLWGLSSTRID
jgi:hypothetical protein